MFGDTVNTASRMYTHCPVGKIQMTKETVDCLSDWFTWKPNPLGNTLFSVVLLVYYVDADPFGLIECAEWWDCQEKW